MNDRRREKKRYIKNYLFILITYNGFNKALRINIGWGGIRDTENYLFISITYNLSIFQAPYILVFSSMSFSLKYSMHCIILSRKGQIKMLNFIKIIFYNSINFKYFLFNYKF